MANETDQPQQSPCEANQPQQTPCETVQPQPAACETVQPQPAACETVQPQPAACETVQPQPAACETVQPQPAACETVQPQPAACETVQPQPAACETVQPQPAACETVQPQPAACEAAQPQQAPCETVQPQPVACETVQPQQTPCETAQPQPVACETEQPQLAACEAAQPQPAACEAVQPQPVACETVQPQPVACETVQPQPAACEAVQPQPVACETVQPQPAACEAVQPQPVACETVQPQPAACEAVQPQPIACETVQPQLAACEAAQPQPAACETVQPQPVACETEQPQLAACEAVQPQPVACETVQPQPVACETEQPQPAACETVQPQPVACETEQPQPAACETEQPQQAACEANQPQPAPCKTEQTPQEASKQAKQEEIPNSEKTFRDLGLSKKTLEAIRQKGFEKPTEIQAMTIPVMLRDDTNIIAQAQTGTGKTAAFGLPLIEMIDPDSRFVQAMILAPTRELAIQVSDEINSLAGKTKIKSMPIYGGQSIDQQLRKLKKGVHIVVGTPGRVIDHLNRKTLKLKHIDHLILDEADEMLNMGFIEDMEEIMKHTKADKRTLLFSATMPKRIQDLAYKYMEGYELLKAKKTDQTANLTEQIYYEVKMSDKFEVLCRIIDIEPKFYGLIFCRTKSDVDSVASNLTQRGYNAEAIHGDISQTQRERTLGKFKRKAVNILVATDVAARGIDVNNMTHVINYSIPHDPEVYVHRIGRTGRAGNQGTAITFITPSEYRRFMFIQRTVKADIRKATVPKVKDIIKAKKRKIFQDLTAVLNSDIDEKYYNWAKKLLDENPPTEILAALLNFTFKEELSPDSYGEIREIGEKRKSYDEKGSARLFVAMGKKDKFSPRKLADFLTSGSPVNHKQIKNIQIMDKFSFVTVPSHKADKIMGCFNQKGQKPLITHAKKEA